MKYNIEKKKRKKKNKATFSHLGNNSINREIMGSNSVPVKNEQKMAPEDNTTSSRTLPYFISLLALPIPQHYCKLNSRGINSSLNTGSTFHAISQPLHSPQSSPLAHFFAHRCFVPPTASLSLFFMVVSPF